VVVAAGGSSITVGRFERGVPVTVGLAEERLEGTPVETGEVTVAVEFEKKPEVEEARPGPVPNTGTESVVELSGVEDAETEELSMVDGLELSVEVDERDDGAFEMESIGVTTGRAVGDTTRGKVMALWSGGEGEPTRLEDKLVELASPAVPVPVDVELGELKGGTLPVAVESSELAGSEVTWPEDTGLASNVEVANVELSVVEMLEVNDDSNGVSDRLGISEHSPVGIGVAGSVMGVILVNRVGMSVSVELPPRVGPAACLGILAACVRRHGRFRRGPASTAAMRDKACNISVVVRIFAVLE
jgi:hypothetical protein